MLSRISSVNRFPSRCSTQCLFKRYSSSETRANQAILDMLKAERQNERAQPNSNGYKIKTFSDAIDLIGNMEQPIHNLSDIKPLKGIGRGLTARIAEILMKDAHNGDATRKEYEKVLLREALERIPRLGKVKAQKLLDAGLTDLNDIQSEKYSAILKPTQARNARYGTCLAENVPREDMETVAQFVSESFPSHEVIITGAPRRGASSTTIHILLLPPDHVHVPMPLLPLSEIHPVNKPKEYLKVGRRADTLLHRVIIPSLEERGLIAAGTITGVTKWQGVVRVPERDEKGDWEELRGRFVGIKKIRGIFRMLHISLVPAKSRGAAMVTSTGDASILKTLKISAHKQGMHLNEHGLWKWMTEETRETSESSTGFWHLLPGNTEEDVFKHLGMAYVEPSRRNWGI